MDYELQQTSVIQSELNELDTLALDKSHDLSTYRKKHAILVLNSKTNEPQSGQWLRNMIVRAQDSILGDRRTFSRGQQKCRELTTSVIMFEMFEKRLSKANFSNPRKSFYDSPG